MPPPPLPQDLAMETEMVPLLPPVDELSLDFNGSTPLLLRSRHPHASTPLSSYQPQLPAINEEHQRPPTMGRVLELSEHSPPAPATITASSPISRNWASIFRPRELLPNYTEDDVPVPRLKRRRIIRRQSPERNVVEQRSNQEITTGVMAELLQTAVQEAEPPINAVVGQQHPEKSPTNQQIIDAPAAPPETNELVVPQVMDAPPEVMDTPPVVTDAPPEVMNAPPVVSDDPPEVMDALPMNMESPMPPVACLDELPERPIITSVQIIYQPGSASLNDGQQLSQTGISSTYGPAMCMQSTRLMEDSVPCVDTPLPQQQSVQERVYGDNLGDLAFIVKHTDMLRLMVNHQKDLSDEQDQINQIIDDLDSVRLNGAERQPRYISMPALYTYDSKIVTDMSPVKQSVVHSLMAALITCPRVDMRSSSFIKTRMEAAIAFRVLLELKAANIINLSQDARFASLR